MLPSLAEQQRIGSLFKELDRNIALNRTLLDKLTKLKASLLEQMFPRVGESVPQLRFEGFSEPWEPATIGDCVTLISGRDLDSDAIESEPTSSKALPYVTGASQIDHNEILVNRWTSSPAVISLPNDLLLTCKGTVGLLVINNIGKAHIARQLMALRSEPSKINSFFLQYTIAQSLAEVIAAAKGVIPGIERSFVLNLPCKHPSLAEQQRIGAFFKAMDERIAQQRAKLSKLEQLKQALLEQMFVSAPV